MSGSSAVGLVFEVLEKAIVLRRARIWLFFQEVRKVEDEKEAFMRAVRCGIIEGAQSFSMYSISKSFSRIFNVMVILWTGSGRKNRLCMYNMNQEYYIHIAIHILNLF